MTNPAYALWEATVPLLFPPVCVLCGAATSRAAEQPSRRRYETFCRVCEVSLKQSAPRMRTACERCGWPRGVRSRPRPASTADDPSLGIVVQTTAEFPCPSCRARKEPHRFDRITPLYQYHDAARDAVVAAKYPRHSVVARELAVALAERCRSRWPDLIAGREPKTDAAGVLVTSVPSPWFRQLRRGGSGTRLLAQYTAAELSLPYLPLLRPTRSIAKQALLDDQARRRNVSGAFGVRGCFLKRLQGREVLIVDDVMTTGATADEVAQVLLQAGVRRVSLAVAALAMREFDKG